jgi:hypothetical protein
MPRRTHKLLTRNYLLALLALVIVLAGIYLIFKKPTAKSGVIPVTTQASQPKSTADKTDSNNLPSVSDKNDGSSNLPAPTGTPPNTPVSLQAPSGTFVSDHQPSLSGADGAPSTEVSVCTTTAGATCYLKFTKDGVVKTLPVQTTDGSGSTSWRWDVSAAGFTTGNWQVIAVAALGDQVKSTTDGFRLEVQP